jgi:hypothetical protein
MDDGEGEAALLGGGASIGEATSGSVGAEHRADGSCTTEERDGAESSAVRAPWPWQRGSTKTLRTLLGTFAEVFSNELVTKALDDQVQRDALAKRGTRDDSGRALVDARWKMVSKSVGVAQSGLFSVASDASRADTERTRLKLLQKCYDE